MSISEIQSHIEAAEKNYTLYEARNFDKRVEVLDFLGFHVLEQIDEFIHKTAKPENLILLRQRAENVKSGLEKIDITLFQKLQMKIQKGSLKRSVFKNLAQEFAGIKSVSRDNLEAPGYDNLDILTNGLFPIQTIPEPTKDLETEMVPYQKTPARIVFELAEKCGFRKTDVFFDLGAGLGQVAILINLLTGIKSKGVEFEPAFCNYASACAATLNLNDVTFINADVRNADYSGGTIFFMYSPFKGGMLREVLSILKNRSSKRKIKIFTYGPCTVQVASEHWLDFEDPKNDNIYRLGVFYSR